jgi:hypothetical protein
VVVSGCVPGSSRWSSGSATTPDFSALYVTIIGTCVIAAAYPYAAFHGTNRDRPEANIGAIWPSALFLWRIKGCARGQTKECSRIVMGQSGGWHCLFTPVPDVAPIGGNWDYRAGTSIGSKRCPDSALRQRLH